MMKKRIRFLSSLLAVVLLFSGSPLVAQAASSNTKATTLRLEATEGTVALKNASGKKLSIKDGTKMYSGYAISTDASSYAWISLDSDVLIKLDAGSKATVKQNKKKLEVMLESGKLFFDVSKPLPADGDLNIRTTSMTTGIRGTSGLVSVLQDIRSTVNSAGDTVSTYTSSSKLIVYEGVVTLTYTTAPLTAPNTAFLPDSGTVTTAIPAGFQANVVKTTSVVSTDTDQTDTHVDADVHAVSVKDSLANTGFVAVELASNEALCQKIADANKDVDLSTIREIAAQADALLKKEQAEAAAQIKKREAALREALDRVKEEAMEQLPFGIMAAIVPVFPHTRDRSHGSGSGDEPIVTPETCKITFQVISGGEAIDFATQTVKYGEAATRPLLAPSKNGSWQKGGTDYNFSTAVKEDLVLLWNAKP